MNEPLQPWQGEVWRRGARLGLIWLSLFTGITIALFLLMGVTGWSGTVRALCAMCIGPLLGTMIIIGWWMARHPNLSARDAGPVVEGEEHESVEQ